MDNKINIIGAGNLAYHLAKSLSKQFEISTVFSRNISNAEHLASIVNAVPINSFSLIDESAINIFALPDDVLINVLKTESVFKDKVLIHTSGSTNINIFSSYSTNYGVLYPLQTFSKNNNHLNLNNIPVFIEYSNHKIKELACSLAAAISENINEIDSNKRLILHVSAVFVCNFTNHMYSIGEELLKANELDFKWLLPLIEETAKRINIQSPKDSQTGPALRNDNETIKKHIDFLKTMPDIEKIYSFVSESIYKMNRKDR